MNTAHWRLAADLFLELVIGVLAIAVIAVWSFS